MKRLTIAAVIASAACILVGCSGEQVNPNDSMEGVLKGVKIKPGQPKAGIPKASDKPANPPTTTTGQ